MSLLRSVCFAVMLMLPLGLMAEVVVDINSADVKTLAQHVKGVGEKKAALIVRYRDENGPFVHVDDLIKVQGIGRKIIDMNRSRLAVNK